MSRRPRVPGTPSNPPKLSPAQAAFARRVGPLEGARIPGGCDSCAAHQTIEPVEAGVWMLNVHHGDGCPFLAKLENGRAP